MPRHREERTTLTSPANRDVRDASPPEPPAKQPSVRGATVLGIGSMIGAGIFALLGEAGAVAGAAVWISFLIGGVVAVPARLRLRQARRHATRPRAA